MLQPHVVERIQESINAQIEPRRRSLAATLQGEIRALAARGLAISGVAISRVATVACDELKVRSEIVQAAVFRTYRALVDEAAPGALEDLQAQLSEHISAQARLVREPALGIHVFRDPRLKAREHIESAINTQRDERIRLARNEAAFFLDSLRAATRNGGVATVITIHGNVGAVQTGTHATANIALSGHDRDRLVEALQRLREELARNAEASAEQREHGTELVADVITAVTAEKPNAPKISGLLGGLASTVQTVASLRGAWDFVRDAAIAIGIMVS